MAQSRSGKSTGSSSRRSSSSTRGSSSGKKAASSASRSRSASARENVSRRAQRRKERNSVMGSIPLAAIGILAIAFVIVPGQSVWSAIRSGLFGVFGILTYFVGPFLIYVAYLMASGYLVGKFVAKAFLLALVCSSVPVVFSAFKIGDSSFIQVVQTLFAWGQTRFWAGGVVGGVIGATLVALCGRPRLQLCHDFAVSDRADGVFCRHTAGCGAVHCLPGGKMEAVPGQCIRPGNGI